MTSPVELSTPHSSLLDSSHNGAAVVAGGDDRMRARWIGDGRIRMDEIHPRLGPESSKHAALFTLSLRPNQLVPLHLWPLLARGQGAHDPTQHSETNGCRVFF